MTQYINKNLGLGSIVYTIFWILLELFFLTSVEASNYIHYEFIAYLLGISMAYLFFTTYNKSVNSDVLNMFLTCGISRQEIQSQLIKMIHNFFWTLSFLMSIILIFNSISTALFIIIIKYYSYITLVPLLIEAILFKNYKASVYFVLVLLVLLFFFYIIWRTLIPFLIFNTVYGWYYYQKLPQSILNKNIV